jgi:hypothetical protein
VDPVGQQQSEALAGAEAERGELPGEPGGLLGHLAVGKLPVLGDDERAVGAVRGDGGQDGRGCQRGNLLEPVHGRVLLRWRGLILAGLTTS